MAELWITPPADITLMNTETDEPAMDNDGKPVVASWKGVMLRLLAHPKLSGTTPLLKVNNLLRRKFKASEPGKPFAVPAESLK